MTALTPSSAESYLLAMPRFATAGVAAMKPGLERIEALLETMGRPQDRYPSILVAGTNGKGSVASMLAAISTAAGQRTGLHTSPHLLTLRERMRVDGVPAPPEWLDDAVGRFRAAFERVEASFFEATVALSLLYFAEREVDLAVVEVGLGGRLDATNVLDPQISLVTSIGRDHEEILGSSLEGIAREKAAIARQGRTLLTVVEGGPVLDAMREVAGARGARVESVRRTATLTITARSAQGITIDVETPAGRYAGLLVGLLGDHQAWNAALAIRAWELVSAEEARREQALREGLADVIHLSGLRGRQEVLSERPLLMVDVAHNVDGLAASVETLRRLSDGRRTVALGLMRDKRPEAVARLIAAPDLEVLALGISGDRGLSGLDLLRHLKAAGANASEAAGVQSVVRRFRHDAGPRDGLLVAGSHHVVGEVLAEPGFAAG